jgi:glycerate 2-kinase
MNGAQARCRVLIAPDKFKGTADARRVTYALAAGIRRGVSAIRSDCCAVEIDLVPIADGGDGTVAAAVAAGHTPIAAVVSDATGEPHPVLIAVSGTDAIVELAASCGFGTLPDGHLRPWDSHTTGLGEAIRTALDAKPTNIVVGVGGSASIDVGFGMLAALGARLRDRRGNDVPPGLRNLEYVERIDLQNVRELLGSARIVVASDVDNPLLGATGTVRTYGPQKGLSDSELRVAESGVDHAVDVLEAAVGRRIRDVLGGGAGGGAAAALVALGGAIHKGADFILDLLDIDDHITAADLVITGEGAFDMPTIRHGKGPGIVLARARKHGVPAIVIAGRIEMPREDLAKLGIVDAIALSDCAASPCSVASVDHALRSAGEQIGRKITNLLRPSRSC